MGLRKERGAVAVEFALLVPLMVIVLFAVIEFGIALTRTLSYVSGAREGARYAAVHCQPEASDCDAGNTLIASRITASIPEGYPLSLNTLTVTVAGSTTGNTCTKNAGRLVTVKWTQAVPVDVPFLPSLGWTLHPTGTFRCE